MLVLPSELTHVHARACLQMLVQALRAERGPTLVLDASALQHFDSAALAVLLELRRECLVAGRNFSIRGLTPRLADLAALYGVAELLPVA